MVDSPVLSLLLWEDIVLPETWYCKGSEVVVLRPWQRGVVSK